MSYEHIEWARLHKALTPSQRSKPITNADGEAVGLSSAHAERLLKMLRRIRRREGFGYDDVAPIGYFLNQGESWMLKQPQIGPSAIRSITLIAAMRAGRQAPRPEDLDSIDAYTESLAASIGQVTR